MTPSTILPCGHKRSAHYNQTGYCQTCRQIAAARRARRSRPPARRYLSPQYWRWLREIRAEVRRVSR